MVLNWLDYAVIAGYVLALTAFGTYFARFQRSSKDYFLTGRSVPWWAICFTIVATETSTITFIGVPAAAYTGNMAFLQLPIGYVIGRLIVSALFLPAYFRGDLMTSYQLLEWRFGPGVRTAGAALFLFTRSLADGIRLFTTALVIAVVTGIPVPWTVMLLGSAMIVYTMYGGSAAVIWTDVVQMFVYLAGALIVFFALLAAIDGGWSTVINTLPSGVSGFIVAAIVAAALSPSINAMAATTVNDFYLRYVNETADEQTVMRVSYRATLGWGIVQLIVALACQWMDRSVLDAGLSILSLTAGPVLGAFLVGFATTRVSASAMLGGMCVGIGLLLYVWIATPIAWTWYAFIGAAVTALVALALSVALPRPDHATT